MTLRTGSRGKEDGVCGEEQEEVGVAKGRAVLQATGVEQRGKKAGFCEMMQSRLWGLLSETSWPQEKIFHVV